MALTVAACDWPQLRGGAARDGFNPESDATSITVMNAPGLRLLRQAPVGDPYITYQHNYPGDPVVASGRVFVNGGDGFLHAFNESTLVEIWKSTVTGGDGFALGEPPAAAATSTTVYVVAPVNSSAGSTLFAFNASTGAQIWSTTLPGGLTVTASVPALLNGRVYVGTGTGVTSIDATTGSIVWHATSGVATSKVSVGASVVYGSGGVVKALDLNTGAVIWTSGSYPGLASDVALANGRAIVRHYNSRLRAFDATSGALVWTAKDAGGVEITPASAPAIAYGKVFATTANGHLRAFNETSGAQLWSANAGSSTGVSIANGVAFTASPFRLLDSVNGNTLKTIGMLGSSEPTVANGVFYVTTNYDVFAYGP
jgi:outer membrane protein assembly factor BamB